MTEEQGVMTPKDVTQNRRQNKAVRLAGNSVKV